MLLVLLLSHTSRLPVLFIIEYLHWADPSTLELLSLILDKIAPAPILAVLTSRPEFNFAFPGNSGLDEIRIERLPQDVSREMIQKVVGRKALPPEVLNQLIIKSD